MLKFINNYVRERERQEEKKRDRKRILKLVDSDESG